jgi:cell division transport system permease protein
LSLNLVYSIREGFKGLGRARLATALSISTIAISLSLLGIFFIITFQIQSLVELYKERMVIEVFIYDSLNDSETELLKNQLIQIPEIETVVYISKEEAINQFNKELNINIDTQGSNDNLDLVELFGYNPLPRSFRIQLKKEFRSHGRVEETAQHIDLLEGVDEVFFRKSLFRIIDRYSRYILFFDVMLIFIIFVAAVLLIANTMRLTILSQRKNIQIMELVGATNGFIRRPYFIQGLLQGGIGGIISSLLVFGILEGVGRIYPNLLNHPYWFIIIPFLLGIILGFTGSSFGLRRFF